MKKLALLVAVGLSSMSSVFAADVLNGTQWKTIDDTTGKPKALVEFHQQANGTLSASIKQLLDPASGKICNACTGALKGKPVEGLTIVQNLKPTAGGKYDGGSILDPKSGKTYKLKGEIGRAHV